LAIKPIGNGRHTGGFQYGSPICGFTRDAFHVESRFWHVETIVSPAFTAAIATCGAAASGARGPHQAVRPRRENFLRSKRHGVAVLANQCSGTASIREYPVRLLDLSSEHSPPDKVDGFDRLFSIAAKRSVFAIKITSAAPRKFKNVCTAKLTTQLPAPDCP